MTVVDRRATMDPDPVLAPLQAGMFSTLLELRAARFGEDPGAHCIDQIESLIRLACEITRFVLARKGGGAHTIMGLENISEMAEPAACTIGGNALAKVRHSVAAFGLLNPLIVRSVESGVELVCGHARHRACRDLGMDRVPVVVKALDDMEAVELALLDILQGNGWNYAEPDYLWALLRFYGEVNER